MTLSPNIILGNDYVTAYFADQIWPKTLKDHRKRWDEAAKTGDPTPRSRLAELARVYFRLRPAAADGDPTALEELCARVAGALGYPVYWADQSSPVPAAVAMMRGGDTYDVPGIAVIPEEDEPPDILVIQAAEFTSDPSVLVTKDARPTRLPHRYGDPEKVIEGIDSIPALINFVFTLEHPPRWVLVVGGGAIALVDHRPWLDGKWLGANVDDILSNNDSTSGGELDQLAGWFSTSGTIPDEDGTSLLDAAVDGSQRQAVGVSESLRDAVRAGVEAIANEVLYDRRERRKRSVFGEQGGVTVDAPDLARQAIRWMYRLVVLLYSEARPGIGILPTTADGTTLYERYESGYGLERLRQLALVELESEVARNGTHVHQSLNVLFRLVNDGHQRPAAAEISADGADTWTGIEFSALNSRLFGPKSCPDIDAAHLRDHVLQKVIAGLCFTPGEKGKGRQAVSYANLEINQLGAVYEGLMAYTGFIALEDRNEVAARSKGDSKDGVARSADPSRGSWTIPTTEAHRYPDNVFVTETDPDTGETRPIVHPKGSFVFRLAGRDRTRSASFYTPSVLTEFTVRHALEEWQANHPDLTAADVLQMTILEPALGSGAFANEACDQAAELYLRLREAETGETVPAEDRPTELRKLRAHFAINQTYGVDLNDTAVELAEVSLWLNSMHPGLSAPPLSHRLRRGNSLVGCTRSTYTEDQVAKQPWKGEVFPPTDKLLAEHPLGTQGLGIHHFLLPGEGWGAAAKTGKGNPCRELAPEWCEKVWDWRKEIHKKPSRAQIARAKQLANKIETLWAAAAVDVESHLNAQNRRIAIWNDPGTKLPAGDSTRFWDRNGPYQRLKTIMDAWCALWMWAPQHGTTLPSLDQWFDCVDYLCGERRADAEGRLFGEHTRLAAARTEDSGALFEAETAFDDTVSIEEAGSRWPWLGPCQAISTSQAFFHWELDYAPVVRATGFGLQVGNPPWVNPKWREEEVLAEFEPWWGVTKLSSVSQRVRTSMRELALLTDGNARTFLSEAAENQGLNSLLSSACQEPLLAGIKTNLYLNFLTGFFRRLGDSGSAGVLHPESHFFDSRAGRLRSAAFHRLRQHWLFKNKLKLFTDVHDRVEFGVNVYGSFNEMIEFRQAVSLLHPAILDQSVKHDGSGEKPGIKHSDGSWDLRPHSSRVMVIDGDILAEWVRLFDAPGTPYDQSRLARPLVQEDVGVLRRFAVQEHRFLDTDSRWANCFDEGKFKRDGTVEWHTWIPSALNECVLQGPHILNGTPFAQMPREVCRSNNDWDRVDLESLPATFVPRVNFRPLVGDQEFVGRQPYWDGEVFSASTREAHSEFVDSNAERTLQACLLPPGPAHVLSVNSTRVGGLAETVRFCGTMMSLPFDYLVKTSGVSHITKAFTQLIPIPPTEVSLDRSLMLRTLRLNCVSDAYVSTWEALYDPRWRSEEFVATTGTSELGAVDADWALSTPLRRDLDRWIALCELDAIVSLLLGVSEAELVQMYRSQFSVLRENEHAMVFDGHGLQACEISHAFSFRQQRFEDDLRAQPMKRGKTKLKLWERVEAFRNGDSTVDLAYLVPPFRRADRELAMRTAYRAFAERSGKTEGVSSDPLPEWEVWG